MRTAVLLWLQGWHVRTFWCILLLLAYSLVALCTDISNASILDENNYHTYRHKHTFRATLCLLYLRPLSAPIHNPYIYLCMYARQEKKYATQGAISGMFTEWRGNDDCECYNTFAVLLRWIQKHVIIYLSEDVCALKLLQSRLVMSAISLTVTFQSASLLLLTTADLNIEPRRCTFWSLRKARSTSYAQAVSTSFASGSWYYICP